MALKGKHAKDVAKPDEFLSKSMRAMAWLGARRTKVLIVLGAILVAGVAFTVYSDMSKRRAAKAGAMLASGLEAANAPIVSGDMPEEDEGDEPPLTFRTEKQRALRTIARYKRVLSRFDSGDVAAHARLGLASAYLDLGRVRDAQREYQSVLDSGAESLAPMALEGLAYLLEAQGKRREALEKLDELKQMRDGEFRHIATYHIARIQIAEGKKAEALDLLKNIRQNLPESPELPYLREQVDALIADLEAEGVMVRSSGAGRPAGKAGSKKAADSSRSSR